MRTTLRGYLATTALALSLAALAPGAEALAASDAKKWSAYIDVEGQVSDSRSKGEVNAFLPVLQNRIGLLFLDLRGKLFSEGVVEGNFGLAYRQRMTEGIVTQKTDAAPIKEEPVINSLTGKKVQRAIQVQDGANLTTEVAGLGPDAVIMLDGNLGTIDDGNTLVLETGQTLLGGGSSLRVRGMDSGKRASFTAAGTRPTVGSMGAAQDLVHMVENTHVVGVDFEGGDRAIFADGAHNSTVRGVNVANSAGAGILFRQSDNVELRDSTFSNTGSSSVALGGVDGALLNNVTVTMPTGNGVNTSNSDNLNFSNVTVTDATSNGINIANGMNVKLSNLNFIDSGRQGLRLRNVTMGNVNNLNVDGAQIQGVVLLGGDDVILRNTTIRNAVGNGLLVTDDGGTRAQNVSLIGLDVAGSTQASVAVENADMTTFDGIQVSNSQGIGLRMDNLTGVNASNILIDTTVANGLSIADTDGFSITGLTIRDAGVHGMRISNSTNGTIGGTGAGDGVAVENAGSNGVLLRGVTNTDLTNVSTMGAAVSGMVIRDEAGVSSADITITGGTLMNSGGDGLRVDDADNVTVTDLMVDGAGQDGVDFAGPDAANSLTLNNVTITGATTNGVHGRGSSGMLTVNNSTLAGTGTTGVLLTNSLDVGGSGNNITGTYTTNCDAGGHSGGGSIGFTAPAITCP